MTSCSPALRCFPIILAGLTTAAWAQDPARPLETPPATAASKVGTAGKERLVRALAFLRAAPELSFRVNGEMTLPDELADAAMFEAPEIAMRVTVGQPNRFAFRAEGDQGGGIILSDGKSLTIFAEELQAYESGPAPESLAAAVEARVVPLIGFEPVAALLLPATSPHSLATATDVTILDDESLDGVPCHRLRIEDDGIAGDLWIAIGDKPWIMRYRQDAKEMDFDADEVGADEPLLDNEGGEIDPDAAMGIIPGFDCNFRSHDQKLDIDLLKFEPEPTHRKVDSLEALFMEQFGAIQELGEEPSGKHSSVGQAIPAVDVATLDGQSLSLADLKGSVVILDFWATWCGPCVQGLPKVAEVANQLKADGVVFYSINMNEDRNLIAEFLKSKQLDIPVILGNDELAKEFGVHGIPHSAIVGRDGKIRQVHVGFTPGMENQLEAELRAALAEK